jgi:hypothetical protein
MVAQQPPEASAMALKSFAVYLALLLVALVPTAVFGAWLGRQPWERKEKIAAWDPFIKVMAIAGAVIVGLAAFDRFLDQREQEFLKLEIEANNKKAAVFGQAVKSASTLANAAVLTGQQEKEALATFWRLYWGELAQIEGRDVEVAMVDFGRALQDWQSSGTKPGDLHGMSLALARAVRAQQESIDAEAARLRARYMPAYPPLWRHVDRQDLTR